MSDEELEREFDRLFQLAPGELVGARNALADRLRKLGDKVAAARVKQLVRPTPAAWALNRLHFEQPALLACAQAEAARVRTLHADPKLDPAMLRHAMGEQRAAVAAVVAAAERSWSAAEMPGGLAQQRKLLATVQGWLAGLGDERPGRMTHDLEPGGFEGVQVVAALDVTRSAAPISDATRPAKHDDAHTHELTRAREQLAREQAHADEARARAQALRDQHLTVRRALDDLTQRIQAAERALEALRESRHSSESLLARHASDLTEAEQRERDADAALHTARHTFEALEGQLR